MKRVNDLYDKICCLENIQAAYKNAKKHKKNSYGARLFDKNLEMNLLKKLKINENTFKRTA